MNDLAERFGSLGSKAIVHKVDEFMRERDVSAETREAVTNSLAMMYEYLSYAKKQGKDPTNGKVLAQFLATKGKHMAKYVGNEQVKCGLAITDLLTSTYAAANVSRTGNLPGIVLTWGLAMLDLIEMGNSCEPAQRLYYELFLKESSVKLQPIRDSVEGRMCPAEPTHRSRQEATGLRLG